MRQTTIALLTLLTLASLCGCRTNEATGRLQFGMMSREDEIELGSQVKPELIKEYGGEVSSQALRDYVTEIGMKLAQHTEGDSPTLPWTFTVLDSDVINAFAIPGGSVFISRGLLEAFENEAQLAGVLGHEIGHVTARHIDERITKAQGLTIGGALLGTMVGASTNWGALAGVIVGVSGQGYLLKFGRDQESEADALGVRYMVAAGYDPIGMIQVLEVLKAASEGPRPIEMLSTHPYPETRLVRVGELVAKDYAFARGNPDFIIGGAAFQSRARPYIGARRSLADEPMLAGGCWCGRDHRPIGHQIGDELVAVAVSGARFSLYPSSWRDRGEAEPSIDSSIP